MRLVEGGFDLVLVCGFSASSGSELVRLTGCKVAVVKPTDSPRLYRIGADRLPGCQGLEDVESSSLIS